MRNDRFALRPVLTGIAGGILLLALTACGRDGRPVAVRLTAAAEAGRAGNWEECGRLADGVLQQEPENCSALLLAALAAERTQHPGTALELARKAAEQNPEDAFSQYVLGKMLAASPQGAGEAMTPLRRAARLKPRDRNAWILLAQCASAANADGAPEYFQALSPELRGRPEIRTQLALWYVGRRNENPEYLGLAGQELFAAYKSAPENARIVLNFARYRDYYTGIQDKTTASFYQRFLQLTENNPQLNSERARVKARLAEISERNLNRR